jgi:hypothetical protein
MLTRVRRGGKVVWSFARRRRPGAGDWIPVRRDARQESKASALGGGDGANGPAQEPPEDESTPRGRCATFTVKPRPPVADRASLAGTMIKIPLVDSATLGDPAMSRGRNRDQGPIGFLCDFASLRDHGLVAVDRMVYGSVVEFWSSTRPSRDLHGRRSAQRTLRIAFVPPGRGADRSLPAGLMSKTPHNASTSSESP